MQAVDSVFRRLSSKRGSKKGRALIGATAGYCSTSLFVLSKDVRMLRGTMWCTGVQDKENVVYDDKVPNYVGCVPNYHLTIYRALLQSFYSVSIGLTNLTIYRDHFSCRLRIFLSV